MWKARTRLRVESLEARDVPAILTGAEEIVPVDPTDDMVAITTTTTDVPLESGDTVITLTSSLNGNPPIPEVDLATTITADRNRPSVGDTVTFRVTVANRGDSPATNVALEALLPAGMTFVSAKSPQGTYESSTGNWIVGTVYPGGPVTLTLKAKVAEATEQTLTSRITHSDMPDPKEENNTAARTVVPSLANLRVNKVASSARLTVGATVVFTVSVRNAGPGTARGIMIQDTLGAGLTFVRAGATSHGSFNPATRIWTIPALANGATATLRIIAQVNSAGQLSARANLVSGTGINTEVTKFEGLAKVMGTAANNPTTWSFVSLGNPSQLLPVPSTAKAAQLPAISTTPSPVVGIPSTVLSQKVLPPKIGL